MDQEVVADALDVLGDVPLWRMPAGQWERIVAVVEAMSQAAADRDAAGLAHATADLEMLGPVRATPLGSAPKVPPPPRLHPLRNHLVRALSEIESTPWPELPPRSGPAAEGLLTQYLVVHAFAPATEEAYRRIRQLWHGCDTVLGATQPIDALGLPVDLPAAPSADAALAARRSAEVQAIVRREHDTIVLSVAAKAKGVTWAQWAARWREVGGAGDDGRLIATVTLFAGTVEGSPESAVREVVGDLPPTVDDFWQSDGAAVGPGVLWELPPHGDGRRRRLVVLASADREDELSALVWSRGDLALTPLTQYLLHAAKGYYERRVRDQTALESAEPSWFEELSDAVDVARHNMSDSLRAAGVSAEPTAGPLAADFAAVDTLRKQIDLDRRHARRGAARAERARPTLGLVTVLPEEFVAMNEALDDSQEWLVTGDRAVYRRGRLPSADPARPHEVVLTMLLETGNDAAAHGEANLVRSFPSVDQIIMVGIAAGVPRPRDPDGHVRLGDVVVGTWSLVDFDHIYDRPDGPVRRQEFPRRSALLAARVKLLVAGALRGQRPWEEHLDRLIEKLPEFARPPEGTDVLFSDDSDHATPVAHPDRAMSGHRAGRPKVHEGHIGSSERALRSAANRDRLAERHDLRAFEMEGKGVGRGSHADGRDWLVVRGVSDYGDRWTDDTWRKYAAAAAAAYVRALLAVSPPIEPHGGKTRGYS